MADVLTRKTNRQIILEPLDGSGRRYVLYGMRSERQDFKVNSPTRRTVSNTLLTQQRMVSRRQYSIQVSIFEPTIGDDGRPKRPNTSSLYDEDTNGQVPTDQQLQMLHDMAKAHEDGILLRYTGLTVSIDRAAILSFSAETVYTTGTGTLVIEERPETTIDVEDVAISAEAFEAALQKTLGVTDLSETGSALDALRDGNITPERYLESVQNFIAQVFGQDQPYNVVLPQSDQATLNEWGLGSLPYIIEDTRLFHDDIQLFPSDGEKKPKLTLIPILGPTDTTVRPKGSTYWNKNYVVSIDRLFIMFQVYNNWNIGKTGVRIEVFEGLTPPVTDYRQASYAQVHTEDAAPEPVPSKDIFTGSTRTATPVYTTYMNVPSNQEVSVADGGLVKVASLTRSRQRTTEEIQRLRAENGGDSLSGSSLRWESLNVIVIADYR